MDFIIAVLVLLFLIGIVKFSFWMLFGLLCLILLIDVLINGTLASLAVLIGILLFYLLIS